jgi:uncharacterized surface protein with fasciclin (FAS1) repeats
MGMKILRRFQFGLLALALTGLLVGGVYTKPSSADRGADIVVNMDQMPKVDTTVSLNTLVKAINKAGLAGTLKGTGPYTFFAPTDAAFNNLPAGKWDAVANDPAKLKQFLLGLVVKGSLTKADLSEGKTFQTLAGGTLTYKDLNGSPSIGGARIIKMDPTPASNGVIFVLDGVPGV